MMKFQKTPPWLATLFDEVLATMPGDRRRMFGYPCGFLNGLLVTGTFADRVIVRLSEADRAEALRIEGAEPFDPMQGRPMREYVVLPTTVCESADELRGWVDRAFGFVATLPPKAEKNAGKRRSGAATKTSPRPKAPKGTPAKKRSARPRG